MPYMYGYQPDGTTVLFDLKDGEFLPEDFSASASIIEADAERTNESITKSAGRTVAKPLTLEEYAELAASKKPIKPAPGDKKAPPPVPLAHGSPAPEGSPAQPASAPVPVASAPGPDKAKSASAPASK